MSADTSQLRSEISRLQSDCSRLQGKIAEMNREITMIATAADNARGVMIKTYNTAANTLDGSTNIIGYADQTLHTISAEQDHIELLYRGFKNIETANKKIRELNNQIYFEFANFRMVRKIVRAFIDNTNLEIVTPELIYKSIEKEHLQSPDFWLSASMLAIMHWRNDDKDAAYRAIGQALELDKRQTVLFFMSFNLLLDRKEAALKWFDVYQRTEKTGDDADILLLLLHATNLRESTNDPLTKKIKNYLYDEFKKSESMNNKAEVVELIKDHLVQYNSSQNFVFDSLRNYVKDYPVMAQCLTMAKDNVAVLDFVEKTNTVSRDHGYIYIEKFIDKLLETPDKKERAYTDEIAYNEMIIKCVGDLALASKEFKKVHEHAVAPLNLMQECIGWLFGAQSAECSSLAKSNMFLLFKDLIEEAAKKYFNEYRALNKPEHPVAIKDYATKMNFNNKPAEIHAAEEFYRKKKASQLATIKNTSIIWSFVLAALVFIGGIALTVVSNGKWGWIVAGLVGAIIFSVTAVVNIFGNNKKRAKIEEANDINLERTKKIIDKLFEEYGQYQTAYNNSDRIAQDIVYAIKR